MKYLLFNVAVAAALVFLFTADRGEVQKIAGRVHDAAGDMKAHANKALETGQSLLKRDLAEAGRKTDPVPAAAPVAPVAPMTKPEPQPAAKPAAPPVVTRPEPPSAPLTEPPAPSRLAGNIPVPPQAAPAIPTMAAAGLDPAVAKRRREVLDGIDTAAVAAAPALKEGTRLMTPTERRKELLSLAEEMELLYARSISR